MSLYAFAVLLVACGALAAPPASPSQLELELALDGLPPAEDPSQWNDEEYLPVPVGERFDEFDWKLCRALDARYQSNVVVSPVGVKMLLAMLYEGASGKTARELETGLSLSRDRQKTREKYSAVIMSLQANNSDYVLDVGNKVYADNSLTLKSRFAKILKAFYKTEIENIEFSAPGTVPAINDWVTTATHGHIKQILTEESLSNTVLLLLNAIYFKGTWKHQFQEALTFSGRFYTGKGKSVPAQLMRQSADLYYSQSKELKAKILRLPYLGRKFSMFLVLPDDADGLDNLLNTINPFALREHLGLLTLGTVNVVLPRFKFDFSVLLNEVLQELGIREIFSDFANLQGVAIPRRGNLYVSKVLQKSTLEVNEVGTEAAASTVVDVNDRIGTRESLFNATHPFLFFIEDETTGTVIFVGKVVDPSLDEQHTDSVSIRQGGFTKNKDKGIKAVYTNNLAHGKEFPDTSGLKDTLQVAVDGTDDILSRAGEPATQPQHPVFYVLTQQALAYLLQYLPKNNYPC